VRILRNSRKLSRYGCILCLLLIIVVNPTSPLPREIEERILTNYQIIEQLSADAIDELIANMPSLLGNRLVILEKKKGIGEADFVFENVLVKMMRDSGFKVTQSDPEDKTIDVESMAYRFSFQLIRMSLSYPKISRRYWLGAKMVERKAEIDIFAQLIDLRTGGITWVGDTQKQLGDVIAYSQLKYVEDEQYGFTKPPREELRWSRLVEPIVVGGIVVGLVYLFFSNQSNE